MNEKDKRTKTIIRQYAAIAAGAGLIPITGVDYAAIAGVEYKMLAELAQVYGVEFRAERVRSIVGVLLGAYASKRLGMGFGSSVLKSVPLVGTLLGSVSVPILASGVTWAIGRVFVQHFASGGTFLTFDPAQVREHFQAATTAPAA